MEDTDYEYNMDDFDSADYMDYLEEYYPREDDSNRYSYDYWD